MISGADAAIVAAGGTRKSQTQYKAQQANDHQRSPREDLAQGLLDDSLVPPQYHQGPCPAALSNRAATSTPVVSHALTRPIRIQANKTPAPPTIQADQGSSEENANVGRPVRYFTGTETSRQVPVQDEEVVVEVGLAPRRSANPVMLLSGP